MLAHFYDRCESAGATELIAAAREAISYNEIECLALCLSNAQEQQLKKAAPSLLKVAVDENAAECALALLNYVYEVRRRSLVGDTSRRPPEVKEEDWRERNVPQGLRSTELARLARGAIDRGNTRVARVLLLFAHRLQKSEHMMDAVAAECGWPAWPPVAAEERPGAVVGGWDLSEGAEPVPVSWVNEVGDGARPPQIAYVRRCVDVDLAPDWNEKRVRGCSWTSARNEAVPHSAHDLPPHQCCQRATFEGKPDLPGSHTECNWACGCPPTCSRRSLEKGSAHRLQVFRHPTKGWCLRTLSHIAKDDFVMEYCGERTSKKRADERSRRQPLVEEYVMEVDEGRGALGTGLRIDALHVRNLAAFAAFACRTKHANMMKRKVLWQHWDTQVPHACFFAKRDIEPGEELTYLRRDCDPPSNSTKNCACGAPDCSGRL